MMPILRDYRHLQLIGQTIPICLAAILSVSFSPPLHAQDCNDALEEALESLGQEDYDHIVVMIADCPEKLVDKTKRILAYEMLARAYFVNNKIALTKAHMDKLLDLQPEYDPQPPQYTAEFIKLVAEVKGERARRDASLLRNKWFWLGGVSATSVVTFLILRGGGSPDFLPEAPDPPGSQ